MTHQTDDRGRILRTWDDDGKLIYAARDDADEQARNNHSPFRFGMVRTRGGVWTCVTSVEAQAVWIREAL